MKSPITAMSGLKTLAADEGAAAGGAGSVGACACAGPADGIPSRAVIRDSMAAMRVPYSWRSASSSRFSWAISSPVGAGALPSEPGRRRRSEARRPSDRRRRAPKP